jgi:hypothetical protein
MKCKDVFTHLLSAAYTIKVVNYSFGMYVISR